MKRCVCCRQNWALEFFSTSVDVCDSCIHDADVGKALSYKVKFVDGEKYDVVKV